LKKIPQIIEVSQRPSQTKSSSDPTGGVDPELNVELRGLVRRLKNLSLHIDQLEAAGGSFSGVLEEDVDMIHCLLGYSDDVFVRTVVLPRSTIRVSAVFFPSLVDPLILDNMVIRHILDADWLGLDQLSSADSTRSAAKLSAESLAQRTLPTGAIMALTQPEKAASQVLNGLTAVLFDGLPQALVVDTIGGPKRPVQEPDAESVVRGPREGFTERMRDNLGLLRRRGRDQNLVVKFHSLGTRSRTQIATCYVSDLAGPDLVAEVSKRLDQIHVDSIQDSGQVEEFLRDSTWSPFPLVDSTERPDRAFSALMSGRVVILVDGSPFALMLPTTFPMLLTSPEDYYLAWPFAALLRLVRWVAVPVALLLPALYVALTSFHQGLLPVQLALGIAASRSGVPFPAYLEALLMELTIEVLREAGVRLPGPMGQTITIVGGLVIGQTAVQARLVSQLMVVIVAFTAIATFALPSFNTAFSLRFMRFGFIILASIMGLYGVVLGLVLLTVHAVTITSVGVPYMSGLAPLSVGSLEDTVVRYPATIDEGRPSFLGMQDTKALRLSRDEGW